MKSIEELVRSEDFILREFAPTTSLVTSDGEQVGYIFTDKMFNSIALSTNLVESTGMSEEYYMDCLSLDEETVELTNDGTRYWLGYTELLNIDKDDIVELTTNYDVGKGLRVYPKYSSIQLDCAEALVNILSNDGENCLQ